VLSRVGYDHPFICFVNICILLLVVLVVLHILVVGDVAYVYVCGFIVYRVRLCSRFVCKFIYICVLFSILVYFIMFCVLVFLLLAVAPRLLMRTL